MRLAPVLLMLSLLPGAPALAEETTSIFQWLKPAAEKPAEPATPAAKPAAKKRTAAKTAHGKLPTLAPKSTGAGPAQAKAAAAKPAAAKPVVAKPAATETATAKSEPAKSAPAPDVFAGIPAAERMKVQAALLWAGDYSAAVKGEDPLLAAIKNFQKRKKTKVTGTLTASERAELIGAARDHEAEFGWSVVVDPATGIRIGLPTKLVPNARDAARGTRWSSAHGDVQVETFRINDANLKLPALFEQLKKEPASRRIEYSVLHDDNFFISGLQGLKKFSVKAQLRDGEVRGFTMLYDQMMETIVTPVAVAMASAFSPFPGHSAPFATLAKSVEYGNGLVVSAQGHIVTDRKLTEGCQVIIAAGLGDAVRIADDKDNGLALLRVYGPRKLSPLTLPQSAGKTGELTLIGIPDPKEENGSRKLTEIKARLVAGTAIELRQPVPMAGFSGAAAIDGQGRFVGMMELRNAVLASVEPSAPPVRLVSAGTIREFLSANNVAAAPAPSGDAKASVVRMICVRK